MQILKILKGLLDGWRVSLHIGSLSLCCFLHASDSTTDSTMRLGHSIDWDGSVQLSSGYLYRGINLNDELTPSLNVSMRHESGFFSSFWLGKDDIAGVLGESRDSDIETEYLLGFSRIFDRHWSMSISHIWHEYLQDNQPRSHDFQETVLQLNHSTIGSFAVGHGPDVWTSGMNITYFYYQHRNTLVLGDRVFYSVQELGTNWLTRGTSDAKNIRLDYARFGIAASFDAGFILQFDYSYSRPSRSDFFNGDRVRSQPALTLRKSF